MAHVQGILSPDRPADQPVEIQLTSGGPPIQGRLIDLEGRPLAGASVSLHSLWFNQQGDLDAWLARVRQHAEGNLWPGLRNLELRNTALNLETTTNPDGRFELPGFGREWIAELLVKAPNIATTSIHVLNRDETEILLPEQQGMFNSPALVIHPTTFQVVAPPSKTIEGVVRDAETGKPIPNLDVSASVLDRVTGLPTNPPHDTTDADGHYRHRRPPALQAYRLFYPTPCPSSPTSTPSTKFPPTPTPSSPSPATSPSTERSLQRPGLGKRHRPPRRRTRRVSRPSR